MARRNRHRTRGVPNTTNRRLRPIRIRPLPHPSALTDYRVYHPLRVLRPVPSFTRSARRLRPARQKVAGPFPSPFIRFAVPRRVLVCVRRKARREVLFAFGRGGGGKRRPRRNSNSDIHCK